MLERSSRVTRAVLLCGGEGTRLRPFSFWTPKHLMPVANRPVVAWIFDALSDAGIEDVAIVVSPLHERIFREALGIRSEQGLRLAYVIQEHPRGLAHAVACAQHTVEDEPFLLYLGDNLFELGVTEMLQEFEASDGDATIALTEVPDPSRFGVAKLDGQRIVALLEKPAEPPSNWAVAGAYVFSPRIFTAIEGIQPSARGEYEITDAIQCLIEDGDGVQAHFIQGWWKDVGLPKDLILASELLIRRLPARLDGNIDGETTMEGTVIVEDGAQIRRSQLQGPCIIGRDAHVEDSDVGPNVVIGAAAAIRDSQIGDSIVMDESSVQGIHGLRDSIVGRRSRVQASSNDSHTVLVGDDCAVALQVRTAGNS